MVEHDAETMEAADYILDLGPGAGTHGGRIIAQGTPKQVMANPDSLTGMYLRGEQMVSLPPRARKPKGFVTVVGAKKHNLKGVTVNIPLGLLTCVTGVSGSGKSTLVLEVLFHSLSQLLYHKKPKIDGCKELKGVDALDKIIDIDQSPIGRTPRSNPATYTGLFTFIRDLFSNLPESRVRGYKPGRYSFNVKGGRCAKPVRATASSRSRCISCPMSMSPARSAKASGITARPWRFNTRAGASPISST